MIRVVTDTPQLQDAELEAFVDEDIKAFEEFFRSLGNESLAGPERAIIKTYLYWKTHP